MNPTLNIAPTDNGYRMMLRQFRESIQTHRETLQELDALRDNDDLFWTDALGELNHWRLLEGLGALQREKEASIAALTQGIADIERYFARKNDPAYRAEVLARQDLLVRKLHALQALKGTLAFTSEAKPDVVTDLGEDLKGIELDAINELANIEDFLKGGN